LESQQGGIDGLAEKVTSALGAIHKAPDGEFCGWCQCFLGYPAATDLLHPSSSFFSPPGAPKTFALGLVEQAHSKLESLAGSNYGSKFPQLQKLTAALKSGGAPAESAAATTTATAEASA